jgi:hypothetical protein
MFKTFVSLLSGHASYMELQNKQCRRYVRAVLTVGISQRISGQCGHLN